MLFIFAQVFKYFALYCPFSDKLHTCPYFLEQALYLIAILVPGPSDIENNEIWMYNNIEINIKQKQNEPVQGQNKTKRRKDQQ